MNQWCVTYDFASLYPMTMIQFFIAPENYVGVQSKTDKNVTEDGQPIDLDKHVVCVNGVVFLKRISPTISMLQDVYADRKVNKKKMMKSREKLKEVQDEIAQLESELNE